MPILAGFGNGSLLSFGQLKRFNNRPAILADLFLVGGGGGGGRGGGGGGGWVLSSGSELVKGIQYNIIVGAGGGGIFVSPADNFSPAGGTGGNTSLVFANTVEPAYTFSLIGIGGGGGAGNAPGAAAGKGGSGGGGSWGGTPSGGAAIGTPNAPSQGFGGGSGTEAPFRFAGGGGGGAAELGTNGIWNGSCAIPGDGGDGLSFQGTYYSGGGGGMVTYQPVCGDPASVGGLGGGGGPATSGSPNTGGGGGGATMSNNFAPSGAGAGSGGSGILIIRYPSAAPAAESTNGSPTFIDSGGIKQYTYTGSGSITF